MVTDIGDSGGANQLRAKINAAQSTGGATRGVVQAGDDVMIGGTIVLGSDNQRVIIRALGPLLPVAGKLSDPTLELYNGNGALLQANDNWRTDQPADIIASTIAPADEREAAIVRDSSMRR